MGLRTKAYFIGALLTMYSSLASALGLGEITLNSSLNQPLDAEIQLLHVRDLAEREVLISLATSQEFERAGVDRPFFLSDLRFRLDLNSPRGAVVRVTSREPVREPFLNFIVAAQWPSGRLLREYTLLVDLPLFTEERVAPVTAAPRAAQPSAAPRPAQPAARPSTAPTTPPVTPSRRAVADGSYGPVSANENLWTIASRLRPDDSVTVQQTMLAIQRLNPDAFINDNINLLRRGQVLRVPDINEIRQLSARDAIREVAGQNRSWRDRTDRPSETPRAQLEGSRRIDQTRPAAPTVEGRVTLSSRESEARPDSGASVGRGEASARVASELASTQEELDAATRENAELKSRIRAVEDQIDTMERLVQVSSEELRALEVAAQRSREQAEQAPATDTPAYPADEEPVVIEEEPIVEVVPQPEAVAPPVTATPVQPPVRQKSWMDLVMDNLLYIAGALAALIIAIAAFFYMRNRNDGFDEDFDEDFARQTADMEGEFELTDTDTPDADDRTLPMYGGASAEEDATQVLAEAETEDVVGECDIHIAYGQYDQAEEKLLRALEKEPAHVAARLKLLEAYAAQGDGENFDYHYARLYLLADQEVLDRAAMFRSSIDGLAEFDPADHDTSEFARLIGAASANVGTIEESSFDSNEDFSDDTLEFNFEEVDQMVESTEPAVESNLDEVAQTDDNLDFDLQLEDDADVTRVSAQAAKNEDLADLDFDLGELDSEADLQELDFAAEDDLALVDDAELLSGDDTTLDFDDLSVDGDRPLADADTDFDFDLDETDEQPTNKDRLSAEFSDNLVAESGGNLETSDFDFADLDDLDTDLALDSTDKDLPSQNELGSQEFDDLDLDVEPPKSTARTAEAVEDFDVDFDLEKELNLDELDQELDALASDFDEDDAKPAPKLVTAAASPMEEPVTDFDDLFGDLDSDIGELPEAEPVPELSTDEDTSADFLADLEDDTPPPPRSTQSEAANFEIPDFDPENDDDSNLDFLTDNDETATKLDLARAYIDMGDTDGAKDILDEIIGEGNDQQKKEAESLMSRIAS